MQDYLRECAGECNKFIDIGCAEGFYLAGIARWKRIPCIGIDTDPRSKGAVSYAAEANRVSDLVSFSADITSVCFFLEGSLLWLVDVDGSELQVLEVLGRLFESSGWRVDRVLRRNPGNRFVGCCSDLSFLEQVVRGAEGRPGGQSWIAASRYFA